MATVVHTVFRGRKQRERVVARKQADANAEQAEAAEAAEPSEESPRPVPPPAAAASEPGEASNRRHQRR